MHRFLAVTAAALLASPALAQPEPAAAWSFGSRPSRATTLPSERGDAWLTRQRPLAVEREPPAIRIRGADGPPAPLVLCGDVTECDLPTRAITIEAWVRIDVPRPWAGIATAVQDNGSFERGWVLGTEGSGSAFTFAVATAGAGRLTYLNAPEALTTGGWHHVVGVYDGAAQTLFVDGLPVARSTTQSGDILYAPSGAVVVGAYQDRTEVHTLGGALASFAIFDRALTNEQVAERHRSRVDRYPSVGGAAWAMDHEDASWSAYRGNNGRTSYAHIDLPDRLELRWTRQLAPPTPAWPAPAAKSYWQNLDRIEPRVTGDAALHPVLSGGRVFVASSTDDTIRSFDARTGQELWRVTTGGPVRYAPSVADGRVYAGSDDGLVYCLDARTGDVLWTHAVGPVRDRIPGNGRLISPFPVRTGVLVDDGVAYACAGLFPSQGVFAVALDARTGEEAWARSLGERSPQGYMLATNQHLIVPAGRGTPFSLRKADGADGPNFGGAGGTYAVIADDQVLSGPGNDNTMVGSKASTGERVISFAGEHLAIGPGRSYVLHAGVLVAIDRVGYNGLIAERRRIEGLVRGGDESPQLRERLVEIGEELKACTLWSVPAKSATCLAATRDAVLIGREGGVERIDVETGRVQRTLRVDGEVLSIAVDAETIVATTNDGRMAVWSDIPTIATPMRHYDRAVMPPNARDPDVDRWLQRVDTTRGYAVLVDPPSLDAVLPMLLRRYEGVRVVIVHSDAARANRIRSGLHDRGLYGTRASMHHAPDPRLPLTDYVANLVVDLGGDRATGELERIAAPGRGIVVLADGSSSIRPSLEGAGSWTHQFANLSNDANGNDRYTTANLQLQWFGGPGPRRMIDRHMRGPPPLVAGGRTFMVGENRIIGVDSYNGTELWDAALPDSQRYAMPYDGGYITCDADRLFAAVDDELWTLDATNGRVVRKLPLPAQIRDGHHWGYVGLEGDAIYATAMLPSASYTTPGRSLADQSYRSERPHATSKAIFRIDARTGRSTWFRDGGIVVNSTVTVHRGTVCFVESRNAESLADSTGRIPLPTLLASNAWLVALDARDGSLVWESPLDPNGLRNSVYLLGAGDRLVLAGSADAADNDAVYQVRAVDIACGSEIWRVEHPNLKPGQLYHGEQVHHPVVMGDRLVAEPFIYRLATGERIDPSGAPNEDKSWSIRRPGHSCGNMSGSMDCLFFRAGNPTVMDLSTDGKGDFTRLSPSRVGCWINIIPADGLVIIPEASSSCVCHFALQTSMAFRSR